MLMKNELLVEVLHEEHPEPLHLPSLFFSLPLSKCRRVLRCEQSLPDEIMPDYMRDNLRDKIKDE